MEGTVNKYMPVHTVPPVPPPAVTPSYTVCTGDALLPLLPNCLHSYLYLWTKENGSFWIYPTAAECDVVLSGYQWDRFFWRRVTLRWKQLDSFY